MQTVPHSIGSETRRLNLAHITFRNQLNYYKAIFLNISMNGNGNNFTPALESHISLLSL